jgi:hypothetical protein
MIVRFEDLEGTGVIFITREVEMNGGSLTV